MRKVLVDRDWLKRTHRDLDACQKLIWANIRGADPAYCSDAQDRLKEIDEMLAQPAEAEEARDYLTEFAEGEVEAKTAIDELQDALSAVTAERDRLLQELAKSETNTMALMVKHFAGSMSSREQDRKLDECLSEGIAMLESERDQYRDMAGCMDLLRRDLIEAGIVGESCPPMFMTEGVLAHIAKLRAEVEASDWIPLTKATPPDGVPVLRWPGWAAEFSIDEWCNDYGCFLMSIEGGERATHWKPLCAPKAAMAAKEA